MCIMLLILSQNLLYFDVKKAEVNNMSPPFFFFGLVIREGLLDGENICRCIPI